MDRLAPERVAVSLPSTRVDALSPRILEQIRRVRKTGFTLAPEAGTQRLRDVIQKEYREEELLRAARLFADLGWRSLKLYFMIGLPSETEEDVRGIAELSARVAAAAGGRLRVTASVSTFSPKPHTPFQWAGQLSLEETRALQDLARAVAGVLTADCSIECCTYCGACDFEAVRNVDYHPEGAKGSDHRGHQISRWADLAVPTEADDGSRAWETKAWREIRARGAAQRRAAARPRPPMPAATPLPEPVACGDGGAPAATSAGPARARGSSGGRDGERVTRGQ